MRWWRQADCDGADCLVLFMLPVPR